MPDITGNRTIRLIGGMLAAAILFSSSPDPLHAASAPQRDALEAVDSYTITQRGDGYRINISYPHLGNPVADTELAIWARERAAAFTAGVELLPTPMQYELTITYELIDSSSKVVSVIFFISTFMGGAHPEPGMASFVYSKKDGRRLSYADIFMNSDGFLETLSALCRESLTDQLGDRASKDMIDAGTEPNVSNFDLFALTGTGLRIYFPPYQAASYSEGYLNVGIPLAKLAQFKPQKSFWDKK